MSVPIWDRELTIDDFTKASKRVELHPATDRWMMGDRYGTVVKVDQQAGLIHVKLDRSNKTIKLHPTDIDPGSFNPRRLL